MVTKHDDMKPTRPLSDAAAFFFKWAGWSYGAEGPEEGRTRCAERLADAETLYLEAHRVTNVRIAWEDDPDGFEFYRSDKKTGILPKDTKKPKRIERACILHGDQGIASLSGIWDADDNYRRVVRAELASECVDELRTIVKRAKEA